MTMPVLDADVIAGRLEALLADRPGWTAGKGRDTGWWLYGDRLKVQPQAIARGYGVLLWRRWLAEVAPTLTWDEFARELTVAETEAGE